MKKRVALLAAGVCVSSGMAWGSGPAITDPAVRARSMLEAAINGGLIGSPDAGPDVIVGELMNTQSSSGAMTLDLSPPSTVGAVSAYGIGTTSCNIGTANLLWQAYPSINHPTIAQNMYRLKNGAIEQIGIGWLKHGFTALTYNACSNEGYTCSGQGGSVLGIGCSDPYSASLNYSQSNLGPRYDVNASTGVFSSPLPSHATVNGLSKRIQVAHADMENTPGVLYFAEGQYVAKDDSAAGNGANNVSYRRMTINTTNRVFSLVEQTRRRKPALMAWKEYGGPGGTTDAGVVINSYDVQGDGRFWVASKATSLGGGMWHYEVAVQNLTSDRAAGSISVSAAKCASISNMGFHDIAYHSGEPYDGTDWTFTRVGGDAMWTVAPVPSPAPPPPPPHAAWQQNALRWGTIYNYRFDSNQPPNSSGLITVGLFKAPTAGSPATSFTAVGVVPGCKPDFNDDCTLTVADFAAFQTAFVAGEPRADYNGDGSLTIADFGAFQSGYVAGCQ